VLCALTLGVLETLKIWLRSTWKEENYSTDTMSMNVDVGWCSSLDGDWELFGGEVKLDGLSGDCDAAALRADGTEYVGWQAVEDDAASVCSSATSYSCLHSSSQLETCNTSYYFLRLHTAGVVADLQGPSSVGHICVTICVNCLHTFARYRAVWIGTGKSWDVNSHTVRSVISQHKLVYD